MDYYRMAAIAVGAWILAYPTISYFLKKKTPAPMSATEITEQDLETVLHMSHRLRKLGCQEGSALCQKLLDLMLSHGVR